MGTGGKDKEPKQKKKPGRVPTSCAECRRLKLRCDRNVPCEKCVSRGCGSICPNGVLTPGKNNRMILANTEELHDRIEVIMARNRELEDALRLLQDSVSDQPHPLLLSKERLNLDFTVQRDSPSAPPSTSSSSKSPSAFRISPPNHLHDDLEPRERDSYGIDAFGTLSIGRHEECRYLGTTARSEFLAQAGSRPRRNLRESSRLSRRMLDVPLPDSELRDESLLSELLDLLPSQSEALYLCDLYLEYGKFTYPPLSRKELVDDTLAVIYRARQYTGFDKYHQLSSIFIVFAIAELFNPKREPCSSQAREYYHLSRVSLQFSPPRNDNMALVIQCLIHMAQFLGLAGIDSEDTELAWSHIGYAIRLAQSMGLHVDSSRWKLAEDVCQRRHDLFWRLFVSDIHISTHLGRPPGMLRNYIDVPVPPKPAFHTIASADFATQFHIWNIHFSLLFSSVLDSSLASTRGHPYSIVLSNDRKIRNFEIQSAWRIYSDGDASPTDASMYRWLVLSTKEIALINLHRGYFAEALQEVPAMLQRHQYLASVAAIYRSAWRIAHGLTITWRAIPKFLARVNIAWSHGLCAAILLCLLITKAPTSHLVSSALDELDNLTSLFDSAAASCLAASKLLAYIQMLRRKAQDAVGNPSGRPYQEDSNRNITILELERLNGKTSLLSEHHMHSSAFMSTGSTAAIAPNDPTRSRATSATISDAPESSSFARSTSPKVSFHSRDNLHSTLLYDLREFSLGSVPEMDFFDPLSAEDTPRDADVSMVTSPPPTSQETARAEKPPPPTPPAVHIQLHSEPYSYTRYDRYHNEALSSIPPSQAPSPVMPIHSHYLPVSLHQSSLHSHSEPRRILDFPPTQTGGAFPGLGIGGVNPYGSGIGLPPGFQNGWNTGFGHSLIGLDPSWNSLVEQLGF